MRLFVNNDYKFLEIIENREKIQLYEENSFGEQYYPYKSFLLEYFILLQDLPQILKKELYFFDLLCSCKGKITINGLKVKYVCC